MRKMFSKQQIIEMIEEYGKVTPEKVLKALLGQDINVNGITSKGIANTGAIANIGDIATTGAITGKTINQSEPNWETNIELQSHNGGENYIATLTYGKVVLINNSLHIVAIVKCENIGSVSISHPTPTFKKFSLPDNIASKIYDLDGKNLTEAPLTTNCPISPATRIGIGSLANWTDQFQSLGIGSGAKLIRQNLKEMRLLAREGLPTLEAGAVGYSLFAFELVII